MRVVETSEPGVVQYCEAGLIKVGLGGDGRLSGDEDLAGLIEIINACKAVTLVKGKKLADKSTLFEQAAEIQMV